MPLALSNRTRWKRLGALPGLLILVGCAQVPKPPEITARPQAVVASEVTVVPAYTLDALQGIVTPLDLAVDPSGRLLVLEATGPDLVVFDEQGTLVDRWPVSGLGGRSFFRPSRVATTGLAVLLLDVAERLILRLDLHGQFQGIVVDLSDVTRDATLGFVEPSDLASDTAGQLYVSDREGNRVLAFDTFARFRLSFGGFGAGGWQLRAPTALDVDGAGRLFVVDAGNARVRAFDGFGAPLAELRLPAGTETPPVPRAVAAHPDGLVLVLDDRGSLTIFSRDGRTIGGASIDGSEEIVAHPGGRVFVLAHGPSRVEAVDLETR